MHVPAQETKSPPRPKSRIAMWLLALLSVSIVSATVLLSNDMRHLKGLARRFGIELAARPPSTAPDATAIHRPRATDVTLPPSLFAPARPERASDLQWVRQIHGPTLCDRLRDDGLAVTPWSRTAFSADTYECVFEARDIADDGTLRSSRFVVVRGDAAGTVATIRVKLVSPPRDQRGRFAQDVLQIFRTIFAEPHWPDFSAALDAIMNGENYKADTSGIALLFTEEPTRPGAYNLTLTMNSVPKPQRKVVASRYMAPAVDADTAPPASTNDETRLPFLNGWVPRPCGQAAGPGRTHPCAMPREQADMTAAAPATDLAGAMPRLPHHIEQLNLPRDHFQVFDTDRAHAFDAWVKVGEPR